MNDEVNNTIKLYPSNWLITAGIVGFVRIFGEAYLKENKYIEINSDFIKNDFPMKFGDYIAGINNAYGIISDFYNNSPFAQIWQKSMKNTLIDLGIENEKAKKYEEFVSDKKIENKDTFLKNINSILKKLKRETIPHQKFVNARIADQVIEVFNKYINLSEQVTQLAKKKKIAENDLPEKFNDLVNELRPLLKTPIALPNKVKNVVDSLLNYEETDINCSFCNERKAIKRNNKPVILDEIHFTPLASSQKELANFYWEGKPSNFMCLPCELIIYCAAFGFTKVDNRYVFINAPANLKEIVEINNIWKEYLEQKNEKEKSFKASVIEILKKFEKTKAKWTLQNISFIELLPYSENSFNVYSFNIPVETANAVRKMIQSFPNSLKDIYDIFIDHIYSKKPLYDMVGNILYGYLNKERLKNIDNNNLKKSSFGRMILSGKNLKDPKDLLFFLKFQKEVEEYEQ